MGTPLNAQQFEVLRRANEMIANQHYAETAPLYGQLALEMEQSSHPRWAANLHAQAAHTYADAGNEPQALAQSQVALRLFIQYRMVRRTPRFYANITHKLNAKGMKSAAMALQQEFSNRAVMRAPTMLAPARPGRLPTACPQCGAPVRRDELSWVDDQTAECVYCGSLIQTL